MQKALHITTKVLPGGRIEIVDQKLPVGESVDVVVLHSLGSEQLSTVDILKGAPGRHLFKSVEEVESYLEDERASWDR